MYVYIGTEYVHKHTIQCIQLNGYSKLHCISQHEHDTGSLSSTIVFNKSAWWCGEWRNKPTRLSSGRKEFGCCFFSPVPNDRFFFFVLSVNNVFQPSLWNGLQRLPSHCTWDSRPQGADVPGRAEQQIFNSPGDDPSVVAPSLGVKSKSRSLWEGYSFTSIQIPAVNWTSWDNL